MLLILGVAATFTAGAGYERPMDDGSGGPWMNWSLDGTCPPGQLCAEWPSESTNTITVCCVPYDAIDTYEYSYCQTFLFLRPLV